MATAEIATSLLTIARQSLEAGATSIPGPVSAPAGPGTVDGDAGEGAASAPVAVALSSAAAVGGAGASAPGLEQPRGLLPPHQHTLQDSNRWTAYWQAIMQNPTNFKGKTVLDISAGTGLLSWLAFKAGAKKIYLQESTGIAKSARQLLKANGTGSTVIVLECKLADLVLPEKVDVIICGAFGYSIVNGGCASDFVRARDRHLKPAGLMFPTRAALFISPFTDEPLYTEQTSKACFWESKDEYQLDISCLRPEALADHLAVTVLGIFAPTVLMAPTPASHSIDFRTATPAQLSDLTCPFRIPLDRIGVCHGIGLWFDLYFDGADEPVVLSTAPASPFTHWYQIRLLLESPLVVSSPGLVLTGSLRLLSEGRPQCDATFNMALEGTILSSKGHANYTDQQYR